MQGLCSIATAIHGFGELIDLGSGTAKDDGRRWCLDIENAPQRRRLVRTLHHVGGLTHERCFARLGIAETDLNLQGVAEVAFGDAVDARRQRGREHHGLASDWRGLENLLDVLGEAHVEHLVGLVEHHDLDVAQRQRATRDVVHRPPGSGDDDMHALAERL